MVGEVVLGRFRIEDRIGSGGFGTVYRAWDERLQRPVAVKVIDREHGSPRVTREAQAVARLSHRNIATLYELATDGERAFLVSELIEGETLRALGRRGDLNDRLVAGVGADAAAALTHAHRAGVVHRDVKPENILVLGGGARQHDASGAENAKLVDFGIARIAGERTLTATGAVVGTLAYMAPEQADGLRPGPAADVYSLALTLYECLCGEHPLIREGGPAATARAIGEPIAPLAEVRPELPNEMTEAIDAALDPDPEERPLASELESALEAHFRELDGEPLPPIAGFDGEAFAEPGRRPHLAGFIPGIGVAALGLAALIATGAPAPIALAALIPGFLALGRPRPAVALQLALVVLWILLGAGEPGIAALVLALGAPLLLPAIDPRAIALPGLAPMLGLAGLGPVYPALAGLTRGSSGRALLGGIGYLWLAAWEELAHRTLLLGPVADPPAHWTGSAGTALGDVVAPLIDGSVLAGAGVFALAAWALPFLIRGRTPVLDSLGALIWAAGLISALRLVDGGSSPPGLLFGALLAATLAALLTRRLGVPQPYPEPSLDERGSDALA
jgi:eukaryotic-like serine/threonine-protein kinase